MTYGQTVAHEIATRANGGADTNQQPQQEQKKNGLAYKQSLLKTMGQNGAQQ